MDRASAVWELSGAASAAAGVCRQGSPALLSSQMLLPFTSSERAAVRKRTLGRIRSLSHLVANYPSLKVRTGPLPATPSSMPCPAQQPAAQRCLQGKPGHGSGLFIGLCAAAGVLVHGLFSSGPPSVPGASSAPGALWDGTEQGAWWKPRPGSSPCVGLLPRSSCCGSWGQQGPAQL